MEVDLITSYLIRYRLIYIEINYLLRSATLDVSRKEDKILLFTLSQYALLLITKFLEIYKSYSSLAGKNEIIKNSLKCTQPLINRIKNNWTNLNYYRNKIIAHPYFDDSKKEIQYPWRLLEKEDAPVQVAEILLLCKLILLVSATICSFFPNEYENGKKTFQYPDNLQQSKGVSNGFEAEMELAQLKNKLQENLTKFQITKIIDLMEL